MEAVRTIIYIIISPIWFPLALFVILADKIEDFLNVLDNLLQKILDKIIPQIW